MFTQFIEKKLKTAKYKILSDGTYYGEVSSLRGVWANAKSLEKCRQELQEILEGWLLLKVQANEKVSGLSFTFNKRQLLENA